MATALGQLLLNAEQRWPNRPALHMASVDHSYQSLMARARLMASALIDLTTDVEGPVRTVLAIDKSVDGYASIIATQLANQTWIPLSPSFPVERNCRIIEQSKPSILVLGPAYRNQAEHLVSQCGSYCKVVFIGWTELDDWTEQLVDSRIVWLSEESLTAAALIAAAEGEAIELAQVNRPCDLAYIMFTSGSTGLPKGVSVTQDNVMAYLKRMESIYDATCEDKFSQFFEFTFDLSVHDLFVCWQAGGCLYPAGLADNLMPTAYVRRHELTFWFSVPTMAASLESLGQLKVDSMPSLKHVLFCGEALPNRVVKGFQLAASNAVVDNLYGPTEATIAFTIKRFDELLADSDGIAGIGKAFDGLDVCIVDENFKACPAGEKGQLLLGGDQLAAGYWQRDDLTNGVFISVDVSVGVDGSGAHSQQHKRWYCSGDLASIDENGEIAFFGRMDNQIKIRGYRIELQEVEQLIAKATGVSNVAALAVYKDANSEVGRSADGIEAFVVCDPRGDKGADKSVDELLALCKAHLPAYMVPERIEVMDKLPTNASGKVDRKRLRV